MDTLGEYLRRIREERQLTLVELAARTRIKSAYLAALETDDYAQLPGEAYAKAFLRLCARELGCDPVRLLQLYEAGVSAKPMSTDGPVRRRGYGAPLLRARTIYWLFFIAFICTVVLGVRLVVSSVVQPYNAASDVETPPTPVTVESVPAVVVEPAGVVDATPMEPPPGATVVYPGRNAADFGHME